jgi:hypothetical protein
MWLSLIWTNVKSSFDGFALAPSNFEVGTPPATDQTTPVPAQAMH